MSSWRSTFSTLCFCATVLSAAGLSTSSALATPKPPPEYPPQATADWLDTQVRGFDSAQFLEGVNLNRFDSLLVLPPELEFDTRWAREHRSNMSQRDEERLRDSYTEMLKTALETRLSDRTRLTLVDEAGANTLVVQAALTQFRLNAPDLTTGARTESYVSYAGSARLELNLFEGPEQVLIGQLSDFSQTRHFGSASQLKRTNRVVNLRDFRMLSERWATRLGDFLVEARAS